MATDLQGAGIELAVASSRRSASQVCGILGDARIPVDHVIDRSAVGGDNKGTRRWVEAACERFSISNNQVVWLGDTDQDMRSAVNAGAIYFNAGWASPAYKYGITVARPDLFSLMVVEFFAKENLWFWRLDAEDARHRKVTGRSWVDSRGAGVDHLQKLLLRSFKDDVDAAIGAFSVGDFATYHVLGSLYAEGIAGRADTWTIYPGREGGLSPILGRFIDLAARLLRHRPAEDVLLRHRNAVHSAEARKNADLGFENQMESLRLNPERRAVVENKCVLVVDDYITAGNSQECARNLLLEAGAREVISVSIGRYNYGYNTMAPDADYVWNPYEVFPEDGAGHFVKSRVREQRDAAVLQAIRDSYHRVSGWRP